MQVKKDSVQKAILEAAENEFLAHGFEKSSMRRMALAANTGMSNFYNYFRSKEDLFAYIVEERSKSISTLFDRLLAEDCGTAFRGITDYRQLLYNLRRWASRFDILYNRETLLLLTSASGTLFEPTRRQIIDSMASVLLKLTSWDMTGGLPDKYPIRHFVTQLLDDMIETATLYKDRHDVREILRNQLVTEIAGAFLMLN